MSTTAPVEVFWISGSPYSWRVLLALVIKQVPYESHLLSVDKGDTRSDAFRQINPRGRVPALRHGAVAMGESMTILRYLERCFPQPKLFGKDAAGEAAINQQIDEIENYLVPHTHAFTLAVFGQEVAGKEAVMNARVEQIHNELQSMDAKMGSWLVGDTMSAADIVLYPVVAGLLRAAGKPVAQALDLKYMPFAERYAKLNEWTGRIEAVPGFDATYPPHWRG